MTRPILETKLYIPSTHPAWVFRSRLIAQLAQGLQQGKLTLISAPAGYGKTSLLAEWAAHCAQARPPLAIAWLSLDKSDNDPARFLAYMVSALQTVAPAIPSPAVDTRARLSEPVLITLLNQIGACASPLALILDDYHYISAQEIHDALAFVLDHQPDNLRLVIATRADPPLPLPRLRARGQLLELRQSELRFTTDETVAFLNETMALDLSTQDVIALESRTEGWIAGLQMAALSLQGQSPHPASRSQFVQAFTGSHRFVLDFLVEEVLNQQPPAVQEFLLKTSILERLSGSLCDALLENRETIAPHSQSLLEHLEAANLFIVPLDHERRWYRYHRLFADLLQQRLQRTAPDSLPTLHRRASLWHEQHGLAATAIEHTLAAHDFERAADLIDRNAQATLMRSEIATFLNWVERLPNESVRPRPTLCFFHAWTLLMSGQPLDVVERRLQDAADQDTSAALAGHLTTFHAYRLILQANVPRAAELGRQALALLPENEQFMRSAASWIVRTAELADGVVEDDDQALAALVTMSKIDNPMIAVPALCYQARLQMRHGHLQRAHETLQQALQWATDSQGRWLPVASKALIGLGELEREWGNLEKAAGLIVEGIRLARQWSEMAAFDGYFPLARIRLAQGDPEAARQTIKAAQQLALQSKITEVDDLVADLQQAHLLVAQGDVEMATRWAEKHGLLPGPAPQPSVTPSGAQDYVSAHLQKYKQLVVARLFLLKGRPLQALDSLAPLLALARQLGRVDLIVETQILRALAYQATGQDTPALTALADALSLAEPGGYVRIFVDEGQAMARLLRLAAAHDVAPAYATKLLAACGEPQPTTAEAPRRTQPLPEPLSEREVAVLRLLATGMSNPEIADELVIAASTVRSHCKSIYGKLDVHKRWDAVQRARELGLIP